MLQECFNLSQLPRPDEGLVFSPGKLCSGGQLVNSSFDLLLCFSQTISTKNLILYANSLLDICSLIIFLETPIPIP